jgi:hypothetical protein
MYVLIYNTCVYIYIYKWRERKSGRERERERERERARARERERYISTTIAHTLKTNRADIRTWKCDSLKLTNPKTHIIDLTHNLNTR